MRDGLKIRSYLEIENPTDPLIELYQHWSFQGSSVLKSFLGENGFIAIDFVPPAPWKSALPPWWPQPVKPSRLVFAFYHETIKAPSVLRNAKVLGDDVSVNAAPPIAPADVWCGSGGSTLFGTRANALDLIGVPALSAANATGHGANVVVVDQGLDAAELPTYVGGWDQGGTTAGSAHGGHGMMVARNVLSVAPQARLWDCPLIPDAIDHVMPFIDNAADAMNHVLDDIAFLQTLHIGKWVIVNSWAVYDRRTECPPGDYTNNPLHKFNVAMSRADSMGIDVVFAAGNCGQFCPKARCGPNDRGQGNSILGANSLAAVLTAGAVRVDETWIGYSSQGPGQSLLAAAKPDLCAPSQFADPDDATPGNTGTSTAAALAAGAIAALRSAPCTAALTPAQLRQLLRSTAYPGEPGNAYQFGSGILNAASALAACH